MMGIRENIEIVRHIIADSALKSGRKPEDITLVAVSKTVEEERIREAISCGISHLGENRVQEMMGKMENLPSDIRWNMIGRLQKNKVKFIINRIELVHSLCSVEVAKEIDRLSEKQGVVTDCLIQINIGHEDTKAGIEEHELERFMDEMAAFPSIRIRGLMAIAPNVEDPELTRPYFARMKELFDRTALNCQGSMDYLSMGMSHDYHVAIEEGANIVRVGSAIFGARVY
ncbi:MAG: YggS family pyridoxal phosphate-dependent enzyme [Clostridia bacterium]|nr:YggS family pyridoxal phosphate-dependent enzyme [Clostridia bacterium]